MYIYDFKSKKETIIKEYKEVPVDINKKRTLINIIVTNKNILLFSDYIKDKPWKSYIYEIPKYELLLSLTKEELINKEEDILINKEDMEIIIYNMKVL